MLISEGKWWAQDEERAWKLDRTQHHDKWCLESSWLDIIPYGLKCLNSMGEPSETSAKNTWAY